jgi:hypothetical protein
MGGICSKGSAVDKSPSDTTLGPDRVIHHDHDRGAAKEDRKTTAVLEEAAAKRTHEQPQQQQAPQQQQPPVLDLETAGGAGAAPWDGVPSLARQQSQKSGMGMARAGAAKASCPPPRSYFALLCCQCVCNAAYFVLCRLVCWKMTR